MLRKPCVRSVNCHGVAEAPHGLIECFAGLCEVDRQCHALIGAERDVKAVEPASPADKQVSTEGLWDTKWQCHHASNHNRCDVCDSVVLCFMRIA